MKQIMIISIFTTLVMACGSGTTPVDSKIVINEPIIETSIPTTNDYESIGTLESTDVLGVKESEIATTIPVLPNSNSTADIDPSKTDVKTEAPNSQEVTVSNAQSQVEATEVKIETTVETIAEAAEEEKEEEKEEEIIKPTIDPSVSITETPMPIIALNHDIFDGLLKKHVTSTGKVNYKGFIADKASFQSYLNLLTKNPLQDSWSRNEKMAYWINAYNAFTIKLIIDNYPVKSITDLHGGKPWDQKWIKLGTQTYSLNQIENEILRPQFKDARIHFAVNCAAKSCPAILNKAWTAANLESNLEKQTKAFVNNTAFNQLQGSVKVSKIFEWYAEDFGDLKNFLKKYSGQEINENIMFMDYNWALNE